MNNINLSDKFRSLPLSTKKTILISSAVIFTIVVIFISIALSIHSALKLENDHSNEEITTRFTHRYLIEYNFITSASKHIYNHIEDVILEPVEKQRATKENSPGKNIDKSLYEVVFVESSFVTEKTQPKNTFSFNFEVSDGRSYKAIAHSDEGSGNEYLALIIYPENTEKPPVYAFINADTEEYKEYLLKWINSFNYKNLKIHTDSLEVLEK